jgi:hypothetical protein
VLRDLCHKKDMGTIAGGGVSSSRCMRGFAAPFKEQRYAVNA